MSGPITFCLVHVRRPQSAEKECLAADWAAETLQARGYQLVERAEREGNVGEVAELLRLWSDGRCDLLFTIGGSSLSLQDMVPEATRQVLQREVPGLMEWVRLRGSKLTPTLALFRGVAVIRHRALIVNLPDLLDEVQTALNLLIPLLPRAVAELRGEPLLPPVENESTKGEGFKSFTDDTNEPPKMVAVLETNLDDLSPELYEPLLERLFEAGALDVYLEPIHMKKGRPATKLSVIAPLQLREAMAEIIFTETTTFGIRHISMERYVLSRRWETVETPYGPIRMKVGSWQGRDTTVSPEYEDVKAAASAHGVAAKEVYLAAQLAYSQFRPRGES